MPKTTMLIEVSKCKEMSTLKSFIKKYLDKDVLNVEFDDGDYELHFDSINAQYEAGLNKEVYVRFWWKGERMTLVTLNALLEWLATDVDIIGTEIFEYSNKDCKNLCYKLKSDNALHFIGEN